MNLDEMRKLKVELLEKKRLHELNKKNGGKEFKTLINEIHEKQTSLKRQIPKGRKRKESYFSRIDLGRLSFFIVVLISMISILAFVPFEIKKVFQRRYIPVEASESRGIAEFADQIFAQYRRGGSTALKSKWPRSIARAIVEKSIKKLETIAGKDDFKIKDIHLDRKTLCYSVCYEGPLSKTLSMKIAKSKNGGFSLMSIQ